MDFKKCSKCRSVLPVSDFCCGVERGTYNSWCKECKNEQRRQRYAEDKDHREEMKKKSRQYYQDHKEEIKEYRARKKSEKPIDMSRIPIKPYIRTLSDGRVVSVDSHRRKRR